MKTQKMKTRHRSFEELTIELPISRFLKMGRITRIGSIPVFCAFVTCALITSCGRLPPAEFWTGDGSDSTAIHQLIISYDSTPWQNFLSRLDFVSLLDSMRLDTDRVFRAEDTSSLEWKIRQAYYPNRLDIALIEQQTDTNIIFSFDTTATVEFVTKIKGTARIGCDRVQAYRTDTIIPVNRVTIWKDNMSNFPADWTIGGTGGPWTKATNRFKSESTSVKCTPNATYDNNQDNWMQHSVDFSGYELPSVIFWIWQNIESNDSIYFECFDTVWHIFWSSSGVDTSFKQVEVPDIPKSVSEIRFRFLSDASGTSEGVYIDDVTVTGANATDTLMLFGPGWTSKDSLSWTVIRGETILVKDPNLPDRFDGFLTKPWEGRVWRSLYFEPMRADTTDTSAVVLPRVWQLKKINGGASVRIPDSEDDAPYLYLVQVREKRAVETKNLYDRPDTASYGIHRLYMFPDSIWSYVHPSDSTLDSLEIVTTIPILNPTDTAIYFVYSDHHYSVIPRLTNNNKIKMPARGIYPNGLNYFSIMLCPRNSLIYKNTPFKLRVWQMPVRVE